MASTLRFCALLALKLGTSSGLFTSQNCWPRASTSTTRSFSPFLKFEAVPAFRTVPEDRFASLRSVPAEHSDSRINQHDDKPGFCQHPERPCRESLFGEIEGVSLLVKNYGGSAYPVLGPIGFKVQVGVCIAFPGWRYALNIRVIFEFLNQSGHKPRRR